MDCICLDFDILETNDPKKLMVGDTSSEWLNAEELPAYIYITLPGSKREHIFTFNKKSIQVYNSNNLGLTTSSCGNTNYADLPDGMYKIKLQSGFEEYFVEKWYLKTDKIEREMARRLVNETLRYSKDKDQFIEKMFDVDLKLTSAKSFLLESDLENAVKTYREAVSEFKNIC